jgi:hypothetical protein
MKLPLSANEGPACAWLEDAEFNHVADYLTIENAQTIAHRVNVHDELVAALERLLDAFLEARDMAIKRNPLDGDELVLSLQCAGGAEGAAREALARVKP